MPRAIFPDGPRGERHHRWRRRIFRWGLWNIVHRAWIKLHVGGWHNIPAQGPVIIMGNHISNIDPVVMISFYPGRDIVPVAKIEAFSMPFLRYFVGHWGAIPVTRGETDVRALRLSLNHIAQGDIVMLYAEGTRSPTGLIQGQEGTAYIAAKTNALVVPAATWGGREFPYVWWRQFRRAHIYMRFGQPFRFTWEGRKLPRQHFRQMTDEAMYRIAALLPEEWRGVYGDLSRATTDFLDFDVTWQPTPAHYLPGRVQHTFTTSTEALAYGD